MSSHTSYSSFRLYNECPHHYKLTVVDQLKRSATLFTSFGTSLHEASEAKSLNDSADETKVFLDKFDAEVATLRENSVPIDEKLCAEMKVQGADLAPLIIPTLKEYFGEFKVLAAEEEFLERIKVYTESEIDMKGFIDLVIQTPDGKIHIIDLKSSSWGWDMKKKADPLVTYQLTFYKHFYAQKHNIPLENIETYFVILKRTAKKDRVEVFRVTSGPKKLENALNLLTKTLYNIDKKIFIKNKLHCQYCEFKKTAHCP